MHDRVFEDAHVFEERRYSGMRMFIFVLFQFSCLCMFPAVGACTATNNSETEAIAFLAEYNVAARNAKNIFVQKQWNYETDRTDFNYKEFLEQKAVLAKFLYDKREDALRFNVSDMSPETKRQLAKVKSIGTAAQPNITKSEELSKVMTEIEQIYRGKVCYNDSTGCLYLTPEIIDLMAKSRDYDKLLFIWVGWRTDSGPVMKQKYSRYVELINENSRILGFKDTGEHWRSFYESDTLENDVRALYDQILPLYEQLHAYVRRRLKKVYGESRFPSSGHIPAHILGDLWAQQWDNIYDLVKPFDNKTSVDVTAEMIKQNFNVNTIFSTAEDFFLSLGFEGMTPTFWRRSLFERPNDGRLHQCVDSSYDFYDTDNYRVKTCTQITEDDLMAAFHEMGHIEYFMQYKDQPFVFREAASDAFEEAFGDLITLYAQTPEHKKRLCLVNDTSTDNETDINFLMKVALHKVAFFAFGYVVDKSRWNTFSGAITPDNYNKEWWGLSCSLQGVSPPIPRSWDDFDPGAKYHSASNNPYMRFFLGIIIQFQFHEAACKAANHQGPMHRCDIYNSKAAGDKLREVLKLGSSMPWQQVMKVLTGQDKMDAGPLLKYFQPLMDFLRKENGNDFGWDPACPSGLI